MYTRQSGAEVIKALEGNQENGLSSIQVEVRREKYGSNRLKERKEKGALQLFLEQLQDPLIYILMAAIAISLFLGEVGDAGIIAAVILLNGIVGVIQEDKARKAIEALTRLSSPRALVEGKSRRSQATSLFQEIWCFWKQEGRCRQICGF